MKTTLDLPDDLLIEAKAIAVQRRTTLKALVEHALRRELLGVHSEKEDAQEAYRVEEDGLPYFSSRKGRITSEQVYQILDEDEG